MKRIFLYSHGFATHADDGGIFEDVRTLFPQDEHVLFEYDQWDETGKIAIAASFSERAEKLRAKYAELRDANPEAEINLVCHSQGCAIAALAQLDGVAKTILMAPVVADSKEKAYAETIQNPRASLREDGAIIRERSSGDTTIIPASYWDDYAAIVDLPHKYDELNDKTELIILDALNDTIIPNSKDYSLLKSEIRIERLDTDHNMAKDGDRAEMIALLKKLF